MALVFKTSTSVFFLARFCWAWFFGLGHPELHGLSRCRTSLSWITFWFSQFSPSVQAIVQMALVNRRLFICEFAYSHWKKWSKNDDFPVKNRLLSANSRFAVQNDGTYLQRITRETCFYISCQKWLNSNHLSSFTKLKSETLCWYFCTRSLWDSNYRHC